MADFDAPDGPPVPSRNGNESFGASVLEGFLDEDLLDSLAPPQPGHSNLNIDDLLLLASEPEHLLVPPEHPASEVEREPQLDIHRANSAALPAAPPPLPSVSSLLTALPPQIIVPPVTSVAPLQPNGAEAHVVAANAGDWSNIQLFIMKHQVHRVEFPDTDAKTYIVSNLRKFTIELVLRDRTTRTRALWTNLRVKATVLYENSMPVHGVNEDPLLQQCDTSITMNRGWGEFKLQLGKGVLTQSHQRQLFRIRIEPADPGLADAYPGLTTLTEPLKSITKLKFRGIEPPAAVTCAPAAATAASTAAASASTAAASTDPPPLPYLPNYASNGLPASASLAGQQSPAGQASDAGAGGGSPHRNEIRLLEEQSAQQRAQTDEVARAAAQQRAIIAQIEQQNKELLEELARVRNARNNSSGA